MVYIYTGSFWIWFCFCQSHSLIYESSVLTVLQDGSNRTPLGIRSYGAASEWTPYCPASGSPTAVATPTYTTSHIGWSTCTKATEVTSAASECFNRRPCSQRKKICITHPLTTWRPPEPQPCKQYQYCISEWQRVGFDRRPGLHNENLLNCV